MLTSVWHTSLYNYKGFFIIVFLAVVDANYKFILQIFFVYLSSCLGQETAK